MQLGPFTTAAEKPGAVEFKWIDGAHDTLPPKGFENYFGAPPLYRFIDFDGINGVDDMLWRIRDLPEGANAEDTMRRLLGDSVSYTAPAILGAMDRLISIIDQDPEIEVRRRYKLTIAVLLMTPGYPRLLRRRNDRRNSYSRGAPPLRPGGTPTASQGKLIA